MPSTPQQQLDFAEADRHEQERRRQLALALRDVKANDSARWLARLVYDQTGGGMRGWEPASDEVVMEHAWGPTCGRTKWYEIRAKLEKSGILLVEPVYNPAGLRVGNCYRIAWHGVYAVRGLPLPAYLRDEQIERLAGSRAAAQDRFPRTASAHAGPESEQVRSESERPCPDSERGRPESERPLDGGNTAQVASATEVASADGGFSSVPPSAASAPIGSIEPMRTKEKETYYPSTLQRRARAESALEPIAIGQAVGEAMQSHAESRGVIVSAQRPAIVAALCRAAGVADDSDWWIAGATADAVQDGLPWPAVQERITMGLRRLRLPADDPNRVQSIQPWLRQAIDRLCREHRIRFGRNRYDLGKESGVRS